MTLPPDIKLAQYEILSFIGLGGFGGVYEARDAMLVPHSAHHGHDNS